jgi:transposase
MDEVSIVGVDLAKQVFQLHGAGPDGRVTFRKKLSRAQFARFMAALPPCVVAMEACDTAHFWGREMACCGHDVCLIPPIYVKSFVKRQKNDMADPEAMAEAELRPTMRTVQVKKAMQQSRAMLFAVPYARASGRTTRPVGERSAGPSGRARSHRGPGPGQFERLGAVIREEGNALPDLVRELGAIHLGQIEQASGQIAALERRLGADRGAQEARHPRRRRGHTFASLLVSGGASLEVIGKLLGHSQIRTTQRSAHLADSPLRAGVDAVADLMRSQPRFVCRD